MPSNEQSLYSMSYIIDSYDSFSEGIERHFESVSRSLKDTWRDSPWLPDSIKPLPPPPTARRVPRVPPGYFEASRVWVTEHRAVTAAVIAFVGTGVFLIWRRKRLDRAKRRAKKAKNGCRTEVVVLAGSPHSPLTRSLSLELERRGFIVYIPVCSLSEEQIIQSESRADIRPLTLDITSPESMSEAISHFTTHINEEKQPFPKAPSHTLHLNALVLVPGLALSAKNVTSLSPSDWSDTLNTRLLAPFATIHAFMSLLTSQKSTILFLTPSITSSLTLASHAAESVTTGGLEKYISTLRKESQDRDINVVQFKLGNFDYGLAVEDEQQQLVTSQHFSVADAARQRLEKQGLVKKTTKETSLRELHNNLFDAIVRGKGRNGTIFVGNGSRTYDVVGKWVPSGIVGWLLHPRSRRGLRIPRTPERIEQEFPSEGNSDTWDKVGERDSDEDYVYPES